MMVLKEVSDLQSVTKQMGIPEDISSELWEGDREEVVGKVSSFLLEKGLTWKDLKEAVIKSKELLAVELVTLMEQYICEGIPISHGNTCAYSTLAHIGRKKGNPNPDTIRGKRTKYTYKIEPKGHSGAQP